ncbi:MAG: ribose transport system ATP-binding protein [Thermotogota bacterium]|nr:ribose transport system ATP-binding protein [Thermotogota bacterium]MDK2863948.1 ribose transport system ATP-binding protein [Thermotogota bacterium]HCZ05819.1 D-xylose ABC transporter ATP-binding protein [Thermotogota bacterium]
MSRVILRALNIEKSFPGVKAVDGVSIEVFEGEVHAVVGENGAGKSTLMKVLAGVLKPDAGEIIFNGQQVRFRSPVEAINAGIGYVPQELDDFPLMTVAENIFAIRLREIGRLISRKSIIEEARKHLEYFDLKVNPNELVGTLSTAERQIIQIIRALVCEPKVMIFDEPTSSIDISETEKLFSLIERMRSKGISVLYISHHLSEIFKIAQRVTVLRDGKLVTTVGVDEVDERELSRLMVGRKIETLYGEKKKETGETEVCLEVKNLSSKGLFNNINFYLKKGEILGFFGLIGSGRTELFKAILGLLPIDKGEIMINGKEKRFSGVKDAVKNSVGYLPEDRKREGLFLEMSISDNLIAPQAEKFANKLRVMNNGKIIEFSQKMMRELEIVATSPRQRVGTLSGGNQQKVLLGMWIGIEPNILIVDEPTKGVDIATKQLIYKKLRDLSNSEIGIVVISSDLPEIVQLCDRVIVMREGKIVGELKGDEITEENIMEYAAGVKKEEEAI